MFLNKNWYWVKVSLIYTNTDLYKCIPPCISNSWKHSSSLWKCCFSWVFLQTVAYLLSYCPSCSGAAIELTQRQNRRTAWRSSTRKVMKCKQWILLTPGRTKAVCYRKPRWKALKKSAHSQVACKMLKDNDINVSKMTEDALDMSCI